MNFTACAAAPRFRGPPKFSGERSVRAASREPLQKQSLQASVFFGLLRIAQDRAEIFADIPIAAGRTPCKDSGSKL